MNDVETLYQMAVKEHQAGRIAAAEALYRQILDRNRLFAQVSAGHHKRIIFSALKQ